MYRGNSIWDDIRNEFRREDNMIYRIIIVNIAVFVLVNIVRLFIFFAEGQAGIVMVQDSTFSNFIQWFAVPASISSLIFKPWTLVTYMFLHTGFLHILFNLLWLYWFGAILRDMSGNNRVLPVYVMGGLAGAILYILVYNLAPVFAAAVPTSYALGASAGVLAVVVAAATLVPDYRVHLILLGPVKIKWIALVAVVLDVLFLPDGNAGGHLGHLGGALFGFLYMRRVQRGKDLSIGFNKFTDRFLTFFKKDTNMRTSHKASKRSKKKDGVDQEKVDAILDKISQSGYDSLSKEEKEYLFRTSKDQK